MSDLIDHARRELELVGQFEEDPAFAVSVLAAVSAFAAYPGHSGGSAMAGVHMLQDLLQFKPLSPLTNDPDEWVRHTPDMWDGQNHVWQNKRNGAAFSEDGGLTYHLVDEDKRPHPYHTRITHTMEGQPIGGRFMDGQTEEPVDPERMGMAEPSDFYGGEADTANEVLIKAAPTGVKCSCGEYFQRGSVFDQHLFDNGSDHYAVDGTN